MKYKKIFIKKKSSKIELSSYYKDFAKYDYFNYCYNNIIIIMRDNYISNVLITSDIIWYSQYCSNKIRNYISKKAKIELESIALCASHTHGTPNPEKNIIKPTYSKRFSEYLIKTILNLFEKALQSEKKEISILHKRLTNNNFSISRRKKALAFRPSISYKMQNLPNENRDIDKNIDLIEFTNKKNKTLCVILRATCHPVSAANNVLGADYIGYIRNYFKKKKIDLFFMQGFCGDIRPKILLKEKKIKDKIINILVGKRFRKANKDDSLNLSQYIINDLKENNIKEKKKIKNIASSKKILKKIPMTNGENTFYPLDISIWNWDPIIMIFINAEVLSGFNIESYKNKIIMCIGYSNGMLGYLPTASDIDDGGYEVDKSRVNFKIKHRIDKFFLKDLKSQIIKKLDEILS